MNKTNRSKNKKISRLLIRSLDQELKKKDQNTLAEALKKSPELQREKNDLDAQRQLVAGSAARNFRPGFTQRVLAGVMTKERKTNGLEKFYLNLKLIFRPVAVIGAVLLLALILFNLGAGDPLNSDEMYYASENTVEDILDVSLF
jgi:hypothetical protein